MTDLTHRIQYFLGANSDEGFSSLYGRWVDQTSIQAFYILKGGAGCGKSTLMGQVARDAEKEGYAVEYIRCSGDPDSLDGILIPQKGAALMDGTAPHALAPLGHPGKYEYIAVLGQPEGGFIVPNIFCIPSVFRELRGTKPQNFLIL